MAKYEKQRARYLRSLLLESLGGKCVDCGTTKKLEFDVKDPTLGNGDKHHKMDTSARMSFYRKMMRIGNLTIRCSKCNGKKGAKSEEEHLNNLKENEPF